MTTIIDIAASPRHSSSRSSVSHSHLHSRTSPPPVSSFPSLHAHLDAYASSDDSDDSDQDWATRYGMVRGGGNGAVDNEDTAKDADTEKEKEKENEEDADADADADARAEKEKDPDESHHQDKHEPAILSDDERENKYSEPQHTTEMDTDTDADVSTQPLTAPLLHKSSTLSSSDDTLGKPNPTIALPPPRRPPSVMPLNLPQQSIYSRANSLLACILIFMVTFQLSIGIFGMLLTIAAWNVTCDYPLQFLSLAISILFIAFGCVTMAYVCLTSAEQSNKTFSMLFCLLYWCGAPLFWVGLYWLHRSSQCDASLTEQLYQLYSPLFMVPWLVMLSSIVVLPVMVYYGYKQFTTPPETDKDKHKHKNKDKDKQDDTV